MSELRRDPLRRRWVIIAGERGRRPSDFEPSPRRESLSPCALCRLVADRSARQIIAEREGPEGAVVAVPNIYPALRVERTVARHAVGPHDLVSGVGAHEVVVETPEHGLGMADLSVGQLAAVLLTWRDRVADLAGDRRLEYVQVFRNQGPDAGASLRHPHSQILATPLLPPHIEAELTSVQEHYQRTKRALLQDILISEIADGSRVVLAEHGFVTLAPYASLVPFELQVIPRRYSSSFGQLHEIEAHTLAAHLKRVLRLLSAATAGADFNLWVRTAPNPAALHTLGIPANLVEQGWHWRIDIMPRLVPQAGFEHASGMYINPTAPEEAAAHLRRLAEQMESCA